MSTRGRSYIMRVYNQRNKQGQEECLLMASSASSIRVARYVHTFFQNYCQRGSLATGHHVAQRRYAGARDSVCNYGSIPDGEEDDPRPRSVPVHVAHELVQAGHRYLDVRTRDEFYAGHPYGAINIPYMFSNAAGMYQNSKFVEEVLMQFGKDDKIVIGCKSGRRSLSAATDLQSAGFTHVTNVAGGYSAWTEKGLPISK